MQKPEYRQYLRIDRAKFAGILGSSTENTEKLCNTYGKYLQLYKVQYLETVENDPRMLWSETTFTVRIKQ